MLISFVLFTLFSTAIGNLTASGSTYNQFVTVEVASGDTVWEIAQSVNNDYLEKEEDVRLIAFAIAQENALDNYFIYPGQELIIPISGY
jgi:LysM repeat protein